MMGAVAALEWTQAGGHVDEVVALSLRALEGGLLQERDPNLLTLAALLPMIVGDRDEALQIFDLAMADAHRRGSLFVITGMYLWRGFTLFWRGDLVDAEEQLDRSPSTRPRPGATAPTRCNGTRPISPGASSSAATSPALVARSPAARRWAATPTAPATGATRGSSCWSPRAARRTRSRPPTSTASASPATTTPPPRAGAR